MLLEMAQGIRLIRSLVRLYMSRLKEMDSEHDHFERVVHLKILFFLFIQSYYTFCGMLEWFFGWDILSHKFLF